MENRSLSVAAGLILLLALGGPALAEDDGPSAAQQADWQQRLDKAAALKAEGKARQAAADAVYERKYDECAKRFLVNGCRDKARQEQIAASAEASRIGNEGGAIERQVKREQLADQDRRRAATAPQRAADLRERQAETAAERQKTEDRAAGIRARKEAKAEEGARKKAAEAEKLRLRQEKHAARVAAKMQKAQRRSAEPESTGK